MKVLIVSGSPHKEGNTSVAVNEMTKVFDENNVEWEIMYVGNKTIRGCISCEKCYEKGSCVFEDDVNVAAEKLKEADGFVVATPVYYASANGTLVSFLDRLFYSSNFDKSMKVACCVACARRGGITSTFDQINKYFTISGMPVVSSNYWNGIHGCVPGEANGDEEGKQTMRILARNMCFLMKSIELGKEKFGLPEKEKRVATNFIR